LRRQVEELLFHQAALLDNKAWGEWADLFSDDGVYWMPSTPLQTDWRREASIFAEDRLLMEVRMGRLLHPNAWSQAAQWGTNHIVGNIVIEAATSTTLEVYSRFQMMEMRRDQVRHFGGSYRHTLVKQGEAWKIKLQRVDMTNGQAAYDYVIQAWV
jgi:3-phenylpropionate/cinnamic acid dioxygenase small subunit